LSSVKEFVSRAVNARLMAGEPPIKTTVVGSYPVPDWLVASPSQQALRDATAVVFKTQELAGIDLVADGELYRFDVNHPETNGMIDYFIRPMTGIRSQITRDELRRFRELPGMAYRAEPAGVVENEIGEGTLNLPRDYRRARPLTTKPLKFTVTGPHMLSKVLLDTHYGDPAALAHAIANVLARQVAEIDAEVVQIDEANIPGAPQEGDWAAAAINVVLDAVPGEKAVHICFGNYGGQTVQRGTWDALIGFMNRLHVGHLVLELAHRGDQELEYLREIDPRIGIGLGVVDIKSTVVESADAIAHRLEQAEQCLGPGRIQYIHPDCGFWMLKRSVADAKMRALVDGRDLYVGKPARR
jgi:5-methyltetrahydropteroyltriglutamate--homocysteine methyltransferase